MIRKIFYLLALFLFYMAFGGLVSNSHSYLLPATCAAGFVLAYFIARSYPSYRFGRLFLYYYAPFLLLVLMGSILLKDFSRTFLYFFLIPPSAFLGYRFQKRNSYGTVVGILAIVVVSYVLVPNVLSLFTAKNTREKKEFPEMVFKNEKDEPVVFPENTLIVLDFWNTNCGVCYRKFPGFEALSKKYASQGVLFYSVHVPMPNESLPKVYALVKKLNYTFPTLYASSSKEVQSKLTIYRYPTVLMFRNNTLYYKGNPNYEPYVFINNAEREINRVIKEYSLQAAKL